ncbi:PAS domain-containing sensor histidine kinase [Pseudomonas citronellolis]|uniref:PAS domain-containing sensor histidine kinase n=1 Tax=Pseudomonas citronellolis TaxID=53408 RepID=UPI0020A1A1CA|nr:PAS domain-containing sensor histidine kinase [Pseudomonas citronellolis]MCP1605789.1 PAS domain S-box-containing protein [Pseudomonas citronellolis]MCP1656056.1 PAS domain S-box-containing protein [Pseudomonas citronellolis]MCP1722216.1 PAS domain S-box-containing protein [Pseudomonas citronellolis]
MRGLFRGHSNDKAAPAPSGDALTQETQSSLDEPFWQWSQAHWDLCIELDAEDRVCRLGGRRARCLAQPSHADAARLGDYLERRSRPASPAPELRQTRQADLALRSLDQQPLVFRVQVSPLAGRGCLLLGTDISDLNWQSDREKSQMQCFNVIKQLLSRLSHVALAELPGALGEVLEVMANSFALQSMALVLAEPGGGGRVFACFVRPGAHSLLREGLALPDCGLAALADSTLLGAGGPGSALLRQLCCEHLRVVPAMPQGGQSAWLIGEPDGLDENLAGLSPGDWQCLAGQLALQVFGRLERKRLRDALYRLNLLESRVQGGYWRYDAVREGFEFSAAVAAILELPEGQTRLSREELLQRLHPADADELLIRLRQLGPGGELAQDLRLCPDSWTRIRRWLHLQGRWQGGSEHGFLDGVLLDVSEARQQAQQAEATHARLRNLIDKAPVVIYVQRVEDGQLIPEFYSESAGNLLGLDLQANSWQALAERVHPDDLGSFFERGRTLLREGRVNAEYRLRDGAGQWHWLYDEAKLLRDAQGLPREVVGLWLDVTERHQAAQRIAESEERYRMLVEDSPALICRYSASLALTFVNHTFASFLGEPVDALLGRRLDYWLSERDCSALRARLVEGAGGGVEESWELRFNLPGRECRWLIWSDRLLFDDQGRLREVQAVARDNTSVRHSQQQLAQGAKMAALGQMVSGMAHEMKQPLHVMRLALFNAWQRLDDPQYLGEKLKRVDAQVDRLTRVVNHMGVFSRKSDLDMAPFDPQACCEAVVLLLGESMTQQGITLELESPQARPKVMGFADQLEQVLVNLLANARDALLEKREGDRWIRLGQYPCAEPGWLELHVCDSAGGIEPALLERIFEPFFTTKPVGQGTGLGLSVSHDLIRNMGGSLCVSNAEAGALFVIRLPLAEG